MTMQESKKDHTPSDREMAELLAQIKTDAGNSGYHINPDEEFVLTLMSGLLTNTARYGYPACPCRLADGVIENDRDIICPCDYRDMDLNDHDACYCALYVSDKIMNGEKEIKSIPERRPPSEERMVETVIADDHVFQKSFAPAGSLTYPVWRCKVCGYLCARDNPPEICPICKVKKDRFERFI